MAIKHNHGKDLQIANETTTTNIKKLIASSVQNERRILGRTYDI